ncbi:MAG: hypothetical protein GY811_19080 [Myxococcales bacterium]|nr:hypothetical protein [Myxococcales bacterium]
MLAILHRNFLLTEWMPPVFLAMHEIRDGQNGLSLVLWRKRSFGSESESGDRFVERILTVTQTMRKRGGDTQGFLQQSFRAHIGAPRSQPTRAMKLPGLHCS